MFVLTALQALSSFVDFCMSQGEQERCFRMTWPDLPFQKAATFCLTWSVWRGGRTKHFHLCSLLQVWNPDAGSKGGCVSQQKALKLQLPGVNALPFQSNWGECESDNAASCVGWNTHVECFVIMKMWGTYGVYCWIKLWRFLELYVLNACFLQAFFMIWLFVSVCGHVTGHVF